MQWRGVLARIFDSQGRTLGFGVLEGCAAYLLDVGDLVRAPGLPHMSGRLELVAYRRTASKWGVADNADAQRWVVGRGALGPVDLTSLLDQYIEVNAERPELDCSASGPTELAAFAP